MPPHSPPFSFRKRGINNASTSAATTPTNRPQQESNNKDLRSVVVGLHGRLEQLVTEREYYADRSRELEAALKASAPDVLEQAVAVKTLQIADILLELDDLKANNNDLTRQISVLERDAAKSDILLNEITMLKSQNIRLKKEKASERSNVAALSSIRLQMESMRKDNERLRATIKEQRTSLNNMEQENERISSQFKKQRTAAEETIALQCQVKALKEENGRLRVDLETQKESSTELARIQSNIDALTEENKQLRSQNLQQATSSREITELHSKLKGLELDNQILQAEKDSMKNIRTQLDTLTFENEKLCAQRDADQSVLEDLHKAVKCLKDESAVILGDEEDEKLALKSQVKSLANEVLRLHTEKKAAEHALGESSKSLQLCLEAEQEASLRQKEEQQQEVEAAFRQTIETMKSKIELLEEDKQRMSTQCFENAASIASLTKQVEFKSARIQILEEEQKALQEKHDKSEKENLSLQRKPSYGMGLGWGTLKNRIGGGGASNSTPTDTQKVDDAGSQLPETTTDSVVHKDSKNVPQRQQSQASAAAGKVRRMRIEVAGEAATYAGPVVYGVPNGKGSIRFENGSTYLGDVVNGEMHGSGTLYRGSKNAKGMSRGRFEHNVFVEDPVQ